MSVHACVSSVKEEENDIKVESVNLEDTGLPSPPQDTDVFKERWCRNCKTITTPRWRYGPEGPNTLCNACHLRWRSQEKKKIQALASPIPEKNQTPTEKIQKPKKIKTVESSSKPPQTKKPENEPTIKIIPGQLYCHTCFKTETPVWRGGPDGYRTLCNACGLQWAKKPGEKPKTKPSVQLPTPVPLLPTIKNDKEFITHGLYSDERRKDPKSTPFHFPLPIHYGGFITETQQDFELPLDLLQQHQMGQIKKLDKIAMAVCPPYKKIRQNIFVERKPNKEAEPSVCHCTMEQSCGDDCLNRMLFYECDPKLCPCGDACTNQRFQKKQLQKKLKVFLTEKRGWGLRSSIDIKKGELVTEYCGEIISHKLCEERMRTIYAKEKNFYFLDYRKGEVIDACSKGTEARFINHSCEPNCHIENWAIKGESHMGVFASEDIPAGTELFYDYNFSTFSGTAESHQECHCGSKSCRSTIGKKQRAGH